MESDRKQIEEITKNQEYHLSCNSCRKIWWSKDPFPPICPYCGARRDIKYS